MRSLSLLVPLCFVLAACGDPAVRGAPQLPRDAELTAPLAPYDEGADAQAAVDAAFARAGDSGKRVLVNFGGNWCGDCRILAGMMEIPEFADFMEAHYELVKVDVGDFDRNDAVVARMGLAPDADGLVGVPTVVVTTPDGRIVNSGDASEWTTARERDPQDAMDYFYRYAFAEPAADAGQVAISR